MFSPRFLSAALVLSALLASAGLARAADAPVATANKADTALPSSGGDVANQIDQYLKTSPAAAMPSEDAMGVTSSTEPRKVHGEVSVAAGSGGYRSVYARSDLPVGKTGTLSIAVADSHDNGRYYGGYGGYGYGGGYGGRLGPRNSQSLGIGLNFDASHSDNGTRCPTAADGYRGHRIDPTFVDDDGQPHCARVVPSPY